MGGLSVDRRLVVGDMLAGALDRWVDHEKRWMGGAFEGENADEDRQIDCWCLGSNRMNDGNS